MEKKVFNYNIEKLRFISSLMVVYIHSSAFMSLLESSTFMNYFFVRRISDFAVIFFFAVTGYYIANHEDETRVLNSIKKTIKLYIFATFTIVFIDVTINIISSLLTDLSLKKSLMNMLNNFTLLNFFRGDFAVVSLWYLPASVISLTIIYYMLKFKISDFSKAVITILIYMVSNYVFTDILNLTRYGGFVKGIFCMMIGYFSNKYSKNYKYSFLISCTLAVAASILSMKQHGLLFPLLSLSVFMMLSYCKFHPGKPSILSKLGGQSLYIYIYHMSILSIVSLVWEVFGWQKEMYWIEYILISILFSVALSSSIYKISKKAYDLVLKVLLKQDVSGVSESLHERVS